MFALFPGLARLSLEILGLEGGVPIKDRGKTEVKS